MRMCRPPYHPKHKTQLTRAADDALRAEFQVRVVEGAHAVVRNVGGPYVEAGACTE